jgi:hypothetical protein
MSRNKLKRKQDKQRKHREADKTRLLKRRNGLVKKKKEERETAKLQRDIERLKNRVGGCTIRNSKTESITEEKPEGQQ